MEDREKTNFDHPDSLDTDLLVRHIESLKRGEDVRIPTYDYSTHSRRTVDCVLPPRPIVLIEGILIFTDPNLFKLIDVKIFVDTGFNLLFRNINLIEKNVVTCFIYLCLSCFAVMSCKAYDFCLICVSSFFFLILKVYSKYFSFEIVILFFHLL